MDVDDISVSSQLDTSCDVVHEANKKVDDDKDNLKEWYSIEFKTFSDKETMGLCVARLQNLPSQLIEFVKQKYTGRSIFMNESEKSFLLVKGYMAKSLGPIFNIWPNDVLFFIRDETLYFDFDMIANELKAKDNRPCNVLCYSKSQFHQR
jgi:hypothetical protein